MWVPFSGRYSISGMEGFAGSRDPKPHLVMQIPQGKASNFQALLLIRASICTHPLRKGLPHGTRNGWWQFLPWLLHGFQGRQHLQELWDSQLLLNVCEDLVVYPIILQGMQKRLQGVGPLVFEHILERCKAMLSPNPRSRGRCLRQAPPGQEFFYWGLKSEAVTVVGTALYKLNVISSTVFVCSEASQQVTTEHQLSGITAAHGNHAHIMWFSSL